MTRNLASIQRVHNIKDIEGADKIQVCNILGWQVVIEKGSLNENDLCCYVEIDSLMPETADFEFLRPRKFRIKTIRFKGQISQGIAFPLKILEGKKYESDTRLTPVYEFKEGDDVSSLLGIIKYEPPLPAQLMGEAEGLFPSFIPKTDETRVQVLQNLIDKYKGTKCYITEKIDGSSATYFINEGIYGVCSRNYSLKVNENNLKDNAFVKMGAELDMENKLKGLNINIALQGELCGFGIQNNRLRMRERHVLFFNAFDIDKQEYLKFEDLKQLLKDLNLEMVPVLEVDYLMENDIPTLVKKATERSVITPEVWREGIVIRPLEEIYDNKEGEGYLVRGRVSFKVINPEYLLKFDA